MTDPKEAIKKKANDLRKTLAQLDKLTGQAFAVTTRDEVRKFFGVSIAAVDKWARQGMPGNKGHYDLQKIVVWLRTEGPWRPRGGGGTVEDELIEGPQSEWTEEYRKWKAKIAKLDHDEREESLMPVDQWLRVSGHVVGVYRALGERLALRFGDTVAAAFIAAAGRVEEIIDREFPRHLQANGGVPLSEPPEAVAPPPADAAGDVGRAAHHSPDRGPEGPEVQSRDAPGVSAVVPGD